jgi:hypothetical protein
MLTLLECLRDETDVYEGSRPTDGTNDHAFSPREEGGPRPDEAVTRALALVEPSLV